jgi:hypothetical protein
MRGSRQAARKLAEEGVIVASMSIFAGLGNFERNGAELLQKIFPP